MGHGEALLPRLFSGQILELECHLGAVRSVFDLVHDYTSNVFLKKGQQMVET
jgi:hypothetical protein